MLRVNDFVLPFYHYHTYSTDSGACRFRTFDRISLPNYFDRDILLEFCLHLHVDVVATATAIGAVPKDLGKVMGEGVSCHSFLLLFHVVRM